MIKKTLSYAFLLLLLSSLTITNSSCKKTNSDEDNNKPIELSIDKTNVTPFEVITITATNYTFLNNTYPRIIANRDIEMQIINQKNLFHV